VPICNGPVSFPSQIHSTIKNIYCNSLSYSHCVLFVVCLHPSARIIQCTRAGSMPDGLLTSSHNITYIPFMAVQWGQTSRRSLTESQHTNNSLSAHCSSIFFLLNIHFMFFMIKSLQIQISKNGFQFRILRFSADLWSTISKTPKFYSEIIQFRNFQQLSMVFRNWWDQSL
jgi:hypothetical protein